jgi:adenosylhomocysteine nucleosidase
MDSGKLNFVTALPEEARPIVNYYRLKRRHDIHPFPVYENDNLQLIVTGIGKTTVATATGYLAGITKDLQFTAWLNVGIVGSGRHETGDFILVHKVTDLDRQRHYYPALWFEHSLETAPLVTVEQPAVDYDKDVLFDMEAAAFYPAAMAFSTSELVQCCKIVSDNRQVSIEQITSQVVVQCVEQNLEHIDNVAQALLRGVNTLAADSRGREEATELKAKYHFTSAQQSHLYIALQKWFALTTESPLQVLNLANINNAKALLQELDGRINELPVNY